MLPDAMVVTVVSHTHWDREWYLPFEVFRLRLVDLVVQLEQLAFLVHLSSEAAS